MLSGKQLSFSVVKVTVVLKVTRSSQRLLLSIRKSIREKMDRRLINEYVLILLNIDISNGPAT